MTWLGEQLGRIADEMPEHDLAARAIAVHQRRRRNLVALAAAAVVVVTLVAVTAGVRALPAEPPVAASPPELSTVRIGLIPSVEAAPVYLALMEGYFQEEGLTVEPMMITGAAGAVPQAETGALDLAQTDYTTHFRAYELGRRDFRIVSSLHQAAPGSFAIVVHPESKIRTMADLKGKRVAIPNLMDRGELTVRAALKHAGLSRDDVKLVEVPYPQVAAAIDKGKIAAALLAEPFVTTFQDTGQVRVLENAIPREFENLHTAGIAATAEWVREHPRTLAAFQRALAKAQHLIASDPEQVRGVVPTYTRVERRQAAKVTFGSYPAEPDRGELQRLADLARAHGIIEQPADLGRLLGE
ncbi:MAG TPA: ABC transporter substrate-binding protein [Nonomuraea sp.]|nr:ABC transporter substrate-binding protein [Nonomuraea sp.]